jgi:hypothetical protein
VALASTVTILVHDEEPPRQLGDELVAILQFEKSYQVDLIASERIDREVFERPHLGEITIVVLPTCPAKAAELLRTLGRVAPNHPILPVERSEALRQLVDQLSVEVEGFLVSPLRQVEVGVRVRALMSRYKVQTNRGAIERITEGMGLADLIGEDPPFLSLKQKLPPYYGVITGSPGRFLVDQICVSESCWAA